MTDVAPSGSAISGTIRSIPIAIVRTNLVYGLESGNIRTGTFLATLCLG